MNVHTNQPEDQEEASSSTGYTGLPRYGVKRPRACGCGQGPRLCYNSSMIRIVGCDVSLPEVQGGSLWTFFVRKKAPAGRPRHVY